MLEQIYQYYTAEKSGVVYVIIAGIVIALTGVVLLIKSSKNPISQGLGNGLVISGTLLVLIILSNKYYNDTMIRRLPDRNGETEIQLQQSEIQRMDKVLNVSFRYAFIGFAACITFLMWIIVISKSYYWKGFSIGLLFLVLPLLVADTYNAKRNWEYLEKVSSFQ